ncbi:MAG: hypothetical protein BA864_07970 [Desulfuromonadales bacterium C00003093]|nr:MAG: hypothetical protein BA864_07970 [Desulfuromonadales bacterium C00003093]
MVSLFGFILNPWVSDGFKIYKIMIGGIFDENVTGMNISEALKQGNGLPLSLSNKKSGHHRQGGRR